MYTCDDYVFTGRDIIQACNLTSNNIKDSRIRLFPLIFLPDKVSRPLYPDPYVAGALFIYGNYDDEYLNLPLDRYQVNNNFSHGYNVEYFPLLGKNTVYFQWKGKDTDHRITWKEFFPCYEFFAKNKDTSMPPIPDDYMYSTYKDRVQFIRGVFDLGYMKSDSPDYASINHWSKERLELVQRMLWSMGIPSQPKRTRWRLDIMGSLKDYPGFFYWRPFIDNMIMTDRNVIKTDPPLRYGITKITKIKNKPGVTKHLILEKPQSLFSTIDYLPRVSQ